MEASLEIREQHSNYLPACKHVSNSQTNTREIIFKCGCITHCPHFAGPVRQLEALQSRGPHSVQRLWYREDTL